MQITLNEIEPCKMSVHVEANFQEIGEKRKEVVKAFRKAPVPGSRPGHSTDAAISIHYRKQIDESLKRRK